MRMCLKSTYKLLTNLPVIPFYYLCYTYQDMKIITEQNKVITIPFPQKQFINQLAKVGVKDEKELSFATLVILMGNIIEDFINGVLSIDDLSSMFNHLYYEGFYSHQSDDNKDKFSEIGNVLEFGSELSYYLRHPDSSFLLYLQAVMNFYEQRDVVHANVKEMSSNPISAPASRSR